MKSNLKSVLFLALLASLAPLQGAEPTAKPALIINATNRFAVTGMHCNGCASGVCAELKLTKGVAAAEVSLTNQLATVAYDTNQVSVKKLVKVIHEAGYTAKPVKR